MNENGRVPPGRLFGPGSGALFDTPSGVRFSTAHRGPVTSCIQVQLPQESISVNPCPPTGPLSPPPPHIPLPPESEEVLGTGDGEMSSKRARKKAK